jgi:hypothetical protein
LVESQIGGAQIAVAVVGVSEYKYELSIVGVDRIALSQAR